MAFGQSYRIRASPIKQSGLELESVMQSKGIIATKNKKIEIETAFARLYLDFKSARLVLLCQNF